MTSKQLGRWSILCQFQYRLTRIRFQAIQKSFEITSTRKFRIRDFLYFRLIFIIIRLVFMYIRFTDWKFFLFDLYLLCFFFKRFGIVGAQLVLDTFSEHLRNLFWWYLRGPEVSFLSIAVFELVYCEKTWEYFFIWEGVI